MFQGLLWIVIGKNHETGLINIARGENLMCPERAIRIHYSMVSLALHY